MRDLLSRYADATFWLARYVERAEDLARILDVNETFSRNSQGEQNWQSVLQLFDDEAHFAKSNSEVTAEAVIHFYTLDADHAGSILGSVRAARENARALRPLISTEMWIQINMFYNKLKALGALYWYTVEFGLIMENGEPRIFGAGISSGPTEAVFALEAQSPNRIMLNVDRVMRTDYVIDDLQPTYFVIESFEDLYRQTVERDFDRLYRNLGASFTYANSAVIDVDNVVHRGTQEYFLRGGRGSSARPV